MIALKSFLIIFLCINLCGMIFFGCETLPEKPNYLSYDPNNPNYVDPEVKILFPSDDEVISADFINIEWEGNAPDLIFQYRLNSQAYSSPTSEKSVYFSNLVNRMHYFLVYGKYPTGKSSSAHRISFLIWNYSGPGLSLYPDEIQNPKIWAAYLQLIIVDTTPINSIYVKILFNPADIKATGVQYYSEEEAFLLKNGGRLVNDFEIDTTMGHVSLTSEVLEGNPPDVSGSGRVAEISFKHVQGDSTIIEISAESYFTTSEGTQIPLVLYKGTKIIFTEK